MKNFSYVFPNGEEYFCNIPPIDNHVKAVKYFLKGLSSRDEYKIYSEIKQIFNSYYYTNNSYNYDDFAIFTLGWIKVTSHYKTSFCYAGYDFQYNILNKIYTPNYVLDEVKNNYGYPIKILNIDFKKIILSSF